MRTTGREPPGGRRWWLGLAAAALVGACTPQVGTIGAVLGQAPDGTLTIRDVPPDLAAAKAGLHPGDRILLIDGRDVRTLDAAAVHGLLVGEVGQTVKLTVLRGDEVVRVTLHRTPAEAWQGE